MPIKRAWLKRFQDNGYFTVISFNARNIRLRAPEPKKNGTFRMTMKRELEALAGEVDLDNPRTKRRRELPALPDATIPPVQLPTTKNASDGDAIIQDAESSVVDAGVLKDQATKLWQTVKDAVNKEYVTNLLHHRFACFLF